MCSRTHCVCPQQLAPHLMIGTLVSRIYGTNKPILSGNVCCMHCNTTRNYVCRTSSRSWPPDSTVATLFESTANSEDSILDASSYVDVFLDLLYSSTAHRTSSMYWHSCFDSIWHQQAHSSWKFLSHALQYHVFSNWLYM